jgi:hypothetical protein
MAKFLNKKEQVIDLKLTSYAKYLLSIGRFKPEFYAFFDDNVLYDKKYADEFSASFGPIRAFYTTEPQSDIDRRIKDETQYLETYVHFRGVEKHLNRNRNLSLDFRKSRDKTQMMTNVLPDDRYTVDNAIGDAFLDGPIQNAPAWKILTLSSYITSSHQNDPTNNSLIPQVNINAEYQLRVINSIPSNQTSVVNSVRGLNSITTQFIDGKFLELIGNDPVVYVEEANTQLLAKNFEVEVFELNNQPRSETELDKRYFKEQRTNIQNGFITADKPLEVPVTELSTDSVEYYFDILFDQDVNQEIVCKSIDDFDKSSYYIDIDFPCDQQDSENVFFDIYGSVLEPEICAPPTEGEEDSCQD